MTCSVCGHKVNKFIFKNIVTDQLAKDWRLSDKQRDLHDRKESMFCPHCGCSLRSRALAEGILKAMPLGKTKTLAEWSELAKKNNLKIAEINYAGHLHPFLKDIPGLVLSQYSEETFRAKFFNWLKGIKKQDITNLTYSDNSFDLVIHSEVLEHVPDPVRALSECRRILKKNGVCVFTIPVIKERKTLQRATLDKQGRIKNLLPPSYHGSGEATNLVFWEFGGDFIRSQKLKSLIKGAQVFLLKK